jgi:hypothetical protein
MINETVIAQPLTKAELIERITALMHECNDIPLLDLIEKLLIKSI